MEGSPDGVPSVRAHCRFKKYPATASLLVEGLNVCLRMASGDDRSTTHFSFQTLRRMAAIEQAIRKTVNPLCVFTCPPRPRPQ